MSDEAPPSSANASVEILIVDDSRTQAEMLRYLLETHGYRVRAAGNGQQALQLAWERLPDLIISDIVMPEMDGYAMCQAIKQDAALREIPVILLTTLADTDDIIRGLNAKADYYLTKPYDREYLLSRIETVLANRGPTQTNGDLEITLDGKRHVITSDRRQMLNLLISTYEGAIQQNRKLSEAQLELKTIYEKLTQDRNLLRTLVDTLPDRIYIKDNEGRYILDNAAHMKYVGASQPNEVIGKTVFNFFPPELAEKFEADDRAILDSGQPLLSNEEQSVDTAGNSRWIATTKMPFRDSAGSVAGLICTSRDITERKRAQEQLAHYAEELHQKNAQMQEDLNMARELQQAFLPEQYFTFPKNAAPAESALWFCYHYLPAAVIGGDFFDVLALSETEVGVFIGDVMGHGVRPALITSILRGLVQELRPVASDPGKFMCEINQGLAAILRQTRIPIFASGFYFVTNTATGEICFANAGHPSPLHLSPEFNELKLLRAGNRPGPALGVFEGASYSTERNELRPGDRVVLFTDGLFEVEGENGDFYDERRLLEAIRKRLQLPLAKLFEELLCEIKGFSITRQFDDDMCLVGMEARRIESAGENTPAFQR